MAARGVDNRPAWMTASDKEKEAKDAKDKDGKAKVPTNNTTTPWRSSMSITSLRPSQLPRLSSHLACVQCVCAGGGVGVGCG